jgi:hypothetical protein
MLDRLQRAAFGYFLQAVNDEGVEEATAAPLCRS